MLLRYPCRCSAAAAGEVGTGARERVLAGEQLLQAVLDQEQPLAYRLGGWRRAFHLLRAADPTEHTIVIRGQQAAPLVDAGEDGFLEDVEHAESGVPERIQVE